MDSITLHAKSSSGDPYAVLFECRDGKLFIHCTCKAAAFRQLCKHRVALASGDASMLHDPSEEPGLTQVVDWVNRSRYGDLLTELNEALRIEQEAKQTVKAAKKAIGTAMDDGIDLA